MGIKETRREIIDSGSPLRRHHLSQTYLKVSNEGQRRLTAVLNIQTISRDEPSPFDKDSLAERLPLSHAFKEGMLEGMIDIARVRVEKEGVLPIPQRIANIAIDVGRIYKRAKELGLDSKIVDPNLYKQGDNSFKLRRNTSRYPGIFPYQLFLIEFKKMPYWKHLNERQVQGLINWGKAYVINLTSCDFTLDQNDLVSEMVETFSWVLGTVGITTVDPDFSRTDRRLDEHAFKMFIGTTRRYFQHLRV